MLKQNELKEFTKKEIEQLEEDLKNCKHLVSQEAIMESLRIRKEFLWKIFNTKTDPIRNEHQEYKDIKNSEVLDDLITSK